MNVFIYYFASSFQMIYKVTNHHKTWSHEILSIILPLVKVNQYTYLLRCTLYSKYDKWNRTNVFTSENTSDNQWMTL